MILLLCTTTNKLTCESNTLSHSFTLFGYLTFILNRISDNTLINERGLPPPIPYNIKYIRHYQLINLYFNHYFIFIYDNFDAYV